MQHSAELNTVTAREDSDVPLECSKLPKNVAKHVPAYLYVVVRSDA